MGPRAVGQREGHVPLLPGRDPGHARARRRRDRLHGVDLGPAGLPLQSAYSASKGAIVQLTRQLAVELAPDIRVDAVAPGAIDTPYLHRLLQSSDDPAGLTAAIAADHPLQRIASADEVARTIVFLASGAAAFVTGAILPVDGGFTAK